MRTHQQLSVQLLRLAPLAIVAACSESGGPTTGESHLNDPTYDDLVKLAGFEQYAVHDGDFVDFYYGEQVLREYVETGDFLPSPDVSYSLFHIPTELVDSAQRTGEPVTWSLCRQRDAIRIFHQVVGSQWEAPIGEERNCTPWVQHYDGRMTIEYNGGDEGVYGFVSVSVYPPERYPIQGVDAPNGLLAVGVRVRAQMPSACEDEGLVPSTLALGLVARDEAPDDPLLSECQGVEGGPL